MLFQLEQHHQEIAAAGLRSVAVGLGQPKHAAHYGAKLSPSTLCLANETNEIHFRYGLKRSGLGQMLNPRLYVASAKAAAAGLNQGKSTGDVAMLGGIFIVDEQSLIRYAYVNDFAGDYPPIPDILQDWGVSRAANELPGTG